VAAERVAAAVSEAAVSIALVSHAALAVCSSVLVPGSTGTAASVPNSSSSVCTATASSTGISANPLRDNDRPQTDTEEWLSANRQRKDDQKIESRALQAKRAAAKIVKGAHTMRIYQWIVNAPIVGTFLFIPPCCHVRVSLHLVSVSTL
jgi:hypothetical protein